MADSNPINWTEVLSLLSEAAAELVEAGDPVPDSLIKAYHITKEFGEKADNENQKGRETFNAGDSRGH